MSDNFNITPKHFPLYKVCFTNKNNQTKKNKQCYIKIYHKTTKIESKLKI